MIKDKITYSGKQKVSSDLQEFINRMIQETVDGNDTFERNKKYLIRYAKNENLNYNSLENEIDVLINRIKSIKNDKNTKDTDVQTLTKDLKHLNFVSVDLSRYAQSDLENSKEQKKEIEKQGDKKINNEESKQSTIRNLIIIIFSAFIVFIILFLLFSNKSEKEDNNDKNQNKIKIKEESGEEISTQIIKTKDIQSDSNTKEITPNIDDAEYIIQQIHKHAKNTEEYPKLFCPVVEVFFSKRNLKREDIQQEMKYNIDNPIISFNSIDEIIDLGDGRFSYKISFTRRMRTGKTKDCKNIEGLIKLKQIDGEFKIYYIE